MRWSVVALLVLVLGVGLPPAPSPVQEAAGVVAAIGPVLPVDGPVLRPFDPPDDRYGPGHRGVDLAAAPRTVVRASLPGVVSFSGQVARRGWVTVDHGGGLVTTYGVLAPIDVRRGQRVAAGDPVGRLAPGAAHLDWGARLDDDYLDPLRLFASWRPHLVRLPG